MRIAFDLDGVVANLQHAYVQTAVRLFPELDTAAIASPEVGASLPEAELDREAQSSGAAVSPIEELALTREQSDAVWRHLAAIENFWETLTEIEPGVVGKLGKLADERGWEVLFLTSRPRSAGSTVQRQSQRWLQTRGFELPSVYVVHGSRGLIAKALAIDVVVDDRPANCLDVVIDSQAGAILVWRGKRESIPASARRMGIAVVPSVTACLDALIEIELPEDRRGLLDRLRRLFGLRTARRASSS
jgi:hypothetical protein